MDAQLIRDNDPIDLVARGLIKRCHLKSALFYKKLVNENLKKLYTDSHEDRYLRCPLDYKYEVSPTGVVSYTDLRTGPFGVSSLYPDSPRV